MSRFRKLSATEANQFGIRLDERGRPVPEDRGIVICQLSGGRYSVWARKVVGSGKNRYELRETVQSDLTKSRVRDAVKAARQGDPSLRPGRCRVRQ